MGVSEKWKPWFSDGPGLPILLRDTKAAGKRMPPLPHTWLLDGLELGTP